MRLNFKSLIIVAFILMGSFGFAQTVTNVEELNRLAKQFNEENEAAMFKIIIQDLIFDFNNHSVVVMFW